MKVSQLKSSVQKLFQSIKLSSHLHTINACGACIITVVRRSAHNSMLHKRLKWNKKTQCKYMTSTAFHTKKTHTPCKSPLIVVHLAINGTYRQNGYKIIPWCSNVQLYSINNCDNRENTMNSWWIRHPTVPYKVYEYEHMAILNS